MLSSAITLKSSSKKDNLMIMLRKVPRKQSPPAECNILGIPYRWVCVGIATTLLIQCLCLIITYSFREQIPCSLWRIGIDSLIFQHGDDNWALSGLLIAIMCLCSNTALLLGSVYLLPRLVLLWYLGGLSQFIYLVAFQSFCLLTKSCNRCDDPDLQYNYPRYYKMGFGLCLFITMYFYLTFVFKIQLFYSYLSYTTRRNRCSQEEIQISLSTSL